MKDLAGFIIFLGFAIGALLFFIANQTGNGLLMEVAFGVCVLTPMLVMLVPNKKKVKVENK